MIEEKHLQNGYIFQTNQKKPVHKEFYIIKGNNGLWHRITDTGPVTGNYSSERLLRYLNRYNFKLIGEMQRHIFTEHQKPFEIEGLEIRGAL